MCGRYTLTADGETVRTAYGLVDAPFDYRPRYNIAPQQDVLVVAQGKQARMINARSETVAERAAFRDAFERRRCLIPADGFYEWRTVGTTKVPMRITLGEELFSFAGLWERWQRGDAPPLYTCTILTTSPAAAIADIHDRMPVMLRPEQFDIWLDRDTDAETLKSLLEPYAGDDLQAYVVSNLVNKVENDGPQCIAPALAPTAEQTSFF
jgi:putative SOS response-associated peptidase YedK